MSKKNRRKMGKVKPEPIPRVDFDVNDSKIYLLAALITFHVVPLVFVALTYFMKQNFMLLYTQFAIYFNTMLTAAIGFIYGIKKGFNVKFPIVISFIAALSLVFYGDFMPVQTFNVLLAFGITYALFAFGSILLGAYLKKTFHFD